MSDERRIDEVTGVETTGHNWDGIEELDRPMPAWWVWTFVACIVFSLGYVVLYPAIPLVNTHTKGLLGWNSRSDLTKSVSAAQDAQSAFRDRIASSDLEQIIASDDLFQFAVSAGRSAFALNCSQCHGAGAAGGPGYPNLQDDDWIWGGDVNAIHTTIAHGVRNGGDESRDSQMSAFGADEILSREEIQDVSAYVMSLSGSEFTKGDLTAGKTLFADNCAACHGEDAKGVQDIGGPNLADAIWLYGGTQAEVISQVYQPKHGVMPDWQERLGEVAVKELAVYVYSLGGGQQAQ